MEDKGAERVTIEILKAHCLGGGTNVEIGHRMVMSAKEAETKVRLGYAVVVVAEDQIPTVATPDTTPNPEGEAEVGTPDEIETGEPAVETADPDVKTQGPTSPTPNQPRTGGRGRGKGK